MAVRRLCRQRRTCARSCRPQRQLPPSPQPSRRQLLTYVPSCRCRRPSRQRRDPSRPHRQTRRPRRPRTRRPRWMRWRRRWLPPRTLASRWMTSEKRSCSAHTSRTPSTMHSNAARRPHRSQSAMLALGVIVRWYPLYLLPYLLVLTYYYLLTYPCRSFVPSVLMPPGRERAYPPPPDQSSAPPRGTHAAGSAHQHSRFAAQTAFQQYRFAAQTACHTTSSSVSGGVRK